MKKIIVTLITICLLCLIFSCHQKMQPTLITSGYYGCDKEREYCRSVLDLNEEIFLIQDIKSSSDPYLNTFNYCSLGSFVELTDKVRYTCRGKTVISSSSKKEIKLIRSRVNAFQGVSMIFENKGRKTYVKITEDNFDNLDLVKKQFNDTNDVKISLSIDTLTIDVLDELKLTFFENLSQNEITQFNNQNITIYSLLVPQNSLFRNETIYGDIDDQGIWFYDSVIINDSIYDIYKIYLKDHSRVPNGAFKDK